MARPKKAEVVKHEEKPTTAMDQFRGTVMALTKEFKAALPPQIPVDRFIRTLITTAQMTPELVGPNVNRKSLLSVCMRAAQDGLLLDGREAAPILFRNNKTGMLDVAYVPMVSGLLRKMRNSSEIKSVMTACVHEADFFEYELGLHPKLVHKPSLSDKRGAVVCAYAVVKTKDGGEYMEVLGKAKLDKVQNVSKAKDGPWKSWYEEMCMKTALKSVAKLAPSSTDVDRLIDADNEATGFVQTPAPETQPDRGGRPSYLASLVEEEATGQEEVVPSEEMAKEPPPAPKEEKTVFNYEMAAEALTKAKDKKELDAAWKLFCKDAPMREKTDLSDIYNELVVKLPG